LAEQSNEKKSEERPVPCSDLLEKAGSVDNSMTPKAGGRRAPAVIGTPIDKAYPAENKRLQELIYTENLLISQFPPGKKTYPCNFPERNKLMAAISDATVIVNVTDDILNALSIREPSGTRMS
jgi:hypothetical protein